MAESLPDRPPPGQSQYINDMDRLFWGVERDPHLRNTMTAVMVLAGSPDRDAVMERLDRASRLIPGWRHRLITPPLYVANPRWVVDPNFDLEHHVRWIGAPPEGTLASVLEYARSSTVLGLDKQRPMWTVTFAEGVEGDRTVAIVKIHHVLIDGYGGVGLLNLILDPTPEAADAGPMPPIPEPDPVSHVGLLTEALLTTGGRLQGFAFSTAAAALERAPYALRHQITTMTAIGRNVGSLFRVLAPPPRPLSPIMVGRQGWYRWVPITVDVADLKEAGSTHGVSLNDLFMGGIGYGFALYHEQMGSPVTSLRTAMAITTRQSHGGPDHGNHVLGGHFEMPVGTEDPLAHLLATRELVHRLRDDALTPLARTASTVAMAFGPFLADVVGSIMKNCDLLMSNIPGVDIPLWFCGPQVEALYGFGPAMGTATNATLVSYNGTAHIGLNVDVSAVEDLSLLVECVQKGFEAVLALDPGE